MEGQGQWCVIYICARPGDTINCVPITNILLSGITFDPNNKIDRRWAILFQPPSGESGQFIYTLFSNDS